MEVIDQNVADIVRLSVNAKYKEMCYPAYRLYIDGFLMTERTYILDYKGSGKILEHSPIVLQNSNEIDIRIEWLDHYPPVFEYNVTVHDLKFRKIQEVQEQFNEKEYTAKVIIK